jgi:23S rRNA G2069 N7-methylase RlmK/C1962 C5-methylase RlmI
MKAGGALTEKLKSAFLLRQKRLAESECVRLFHGDTEGDPRLLIEKFGPVFWVFEKEREGLPLVRPEEKESVVNAIRVGIPQLEEDFSVYWLLRPKGKLPSDEPELLRGKDREEIIASELGIKYLIRSKKVRHPGLFLDHFPLRKWLMASQQIRGRVLNTFSYTGSLSCAAHFGGAREVLTLDLSKPTIEWAKENWKLNGYPEAAGDFIFGDVFEWLPKFKKKGRQFDHLILDPPSFSRGKSGTFSTEKNMNDLHGLALDLLVPGGLLISSINSETISQDAFQKTLIQLLQKRKQEFEILSPLSADPVGFPRATHLKGLIVRIG